MLSAVVQNEKNFDLSRSNCQQTECVLSVRDYERKEQSRKKHSLGRIVGVVRKVSWPKSARTKEGLGVSEAYHSDCWGIRQDMGGSRGKLVECKPDWIL